MKLKVIRTGSSGNCYALYSKGGKVLLLDIGVSRTELVRGLDFQTNIIDGAVISHGHSDHIKPKTEEDLTLMGVYIWKPFEEENGRCHIWLGDFEIWSFPVPHDSVPCCGFVIKVDDEYVIYVTDAEYVKYNFKNFKPRAILFECNYQEEYVDMDSPNMAHIFRGHASLKTCIDFLKANQTDNLLHIVLGHMSHGNANQEECQMEVCKAIPNVMVHVAEKDLEVDL